MDKTKIDRGARAFMMLAEQMTDAVRSGTFDWHNFERRVERNRAYIAELAKSDDIRLRELADVMTAVLADIPQMGDPDAVERVVANGRRFQTLMNEVMGYGDGSSGAADCP